MYLEIFALFHLIERHNFSEPQTVDLLTHPKFNRPRVSVVALRINSESRCEALRYYKMTTTRVGTCSTHQYAFVDFNRIQRLF